MSYANSISRGHISDVKSNQVTIDYWVFEKKTDRDQLVICNPSFFATKKKDIPEGSTIRKFKKFRQSFSGLFLFPDE